MADKEYEHENEDVYSEGNREEQLEDDELSPNEDGFMRGYEEADEIGKTVDEEEEE